MKKKQSDNTPNLKRALANQKLYDQALKDNQKLEKFLKDLPKAAKAMRRLTYYYHSDWIADYQGIPAQEGVDLGLLSEDAIYDAITDRIRLVNELRTKLKTLLPPNI